jgi:peroxiredoxin
MANVEKAERAAGFAAQAVQRQSQATERERRWIDAVARYYQIDDAAKQELESGDAARVAAARTALVEKQKQRDKAALGRAFVKDLEAIVFAEPDDIEAKAFLAVQYWRNTEFGVDITAFGAVDALLAQVFERAPMHPAHHYRIHLWDDEKPERALHSAEVNGLTAKGIAHQWHMSGHIFAGLDRHAEAAHHQEASSRADHARMQRDRVMPYEIHNYGHNQEWLARSLVYVGRPRAMARDLAEQPRHPKHNRLTERYDNAWFGRARLLSVCEDYELWDDLLAVHDAGYLDVSGDPRADADRALAIGRALFRTGRGSEAEPLFAEVDALLGKARSARAAAVDQAEAEALTKKDPEDKVQKAMQDAGREPTDDVRFVLGVQRELRGERLLASGDAKAAVAEFEAVDGMPKTLLGDAHVAAGDAEKAIEVLEAEVEERAGRVPTLLRLVLALRAAGRDDAETRARELQRLCPEPEDSPLWRRLPPVAIVGAGDTDAADQVGNGSDAASIEALGPLHWRPSRAPALELSHGIEKLSLAARAGRTTLIVFHLGSGCAHCVAQLQAFSPRLRDFAAAGIDVVAVGTGAPPVSGAFAELPLFADPDLSAFKAWRCYDDFERMALHGTFLVDGKGDVRWQDISAEPFTDVEWLLGECRRLLALPVGT